MGNGWSIRRPVGPFLLLLLLSISWFDRSGPILSRKCKVSTRWSFDDEDEAWFIYGRECVSAIVGIGLLCIYTFAFS